MSYVITYELNYYNVINSTLWHLAHDGTTKSFAKYPLKSNFKMCIYYLSVKTLWKSTHHWPALLWLVPAFSLSSDSLNYSMQLIFLMIFMMGLWWILSSLAFIFLLQINICWPLVCGNLACLPRILRRSLILALSWEPGDTVKSVPRSSCVSRRLDSCIAGWGVSLPAGLVLLYSVLADFFSSPGSLSASGWPWFWAPVSLPHPTRQAPHLQVSKKQKSSPAFTKSAPSLQSGHFWLSLWLVWKEALYMLYV